jgi:hypothetical protein
MKHKIIDTKVLPPDEDGTYTVSYEFDDGVRGFDSGLSKEEADKRARRIGEFEEITNTEHSIPVTTEQS